MEVTASRPSHDQRGARVLVPSLPAPREQSGQCGEQLSTRTVKNGDGEPRARNQHAIRDRCGTRPFNKHTGIHKDKPGAVAHLSLCDRKRRVGVTERGVRVVPSASGTQRRQAWHLEDSDIPY